MAKPPHTNPPRGGGRTMGATWGSLSPSLWARRGFVPNTASPPGPPGRLEPGETGDVVQHLQTGQEGGCSACRGGHQCHPHVPAPLPSPPPQFSYVDADGNAVPVTQLTFLRLLSAGARQNFTLLCQHAAAWYDGRAGTFARALRFRGANDEELGHGHPAAPVRALHDGCQVGHRDTASPKPRGPTCTGRRGGDDSITESQCQGLEGPQAHPV